MSISVRIQASTILEVIISMVIILLVFGIAMMIYTNVLRSSLSVEKIKAQALLQQALIKGEQNKENTDVLFTDDELTIEQKIKPNSDYPTLTEIDMTAFDAGRDTLATLKKLIVNK